MQNGTNYYCYRTGGFVFRKLKLGDHVRKLVVLLNTAGADVYDIGIYPELKCSSSDTKFAREGLSFSLVGQGGFFGHS